MLDYRFGRTENRLAALKGYWTQPEKRDNRSDNGSLKGCLVEQLMTGACQDIDKDVLGFP